MAITKEIRNLRGEIGWLIFDQRLTVNLERPLGQSTSFLRFIFINFSFLFKSVAVLLVPFRFSVRPRSGKKAAISMTFLFLFIFSLSLSHYLPFSLNFLKIFFCAASSVTYGHFSPFFRFFFLYLSLSLLNTATSIDFYPFVPCRGRIENNRFRTHKYEE